MIRRKDILLALVSGLMLILIFPPFDYHYLAWIALVPLFISLWEKGPKVSFFLGTLTGFTSFAGTTYWIFHSVYYYGNVPALLSILLVIALSLYLGLFLGVFSIIFTWFVRRSRAPALFIVPIIWVTLEFIRTYLLSGFPWSSLGYSQYTVLPVVQVADITGVYGVSFMVAAVNGAVFDVVDYWPKRLSRMPLFDRWPVVLGLFTLSALISLSVLYGMWRLRTPDTGHSVRASVIQGNFEQEKKWDVNFRREIIDTYKRLSLDVSSDTPDIIIWPESATPFIFEKARELTRELVTFQKTLNTHLLFGSMMVRDSSEGRHGIANSVILMSPDGNVSAHYDKIHLVPFGEYVPLRWLFPFIGKLVVDVGDFQSGTEHSVMEVPGARISSPICFEIIFPGLVRKFVNKGANLIVTVTNDAWFGATAAPYQHFSMAVFRAVENRVPVIRAANTGISGFIDPLGRVVKKSDIFVESVLTEDVSVGTFRKSFYAKYGDLFAFLCIIMCVLLMANNVYVKK